MSGLPFIGRQIFDVQAKLFFSKENIRVRSTARNAIVIQSFQISKIPSNHGQNMTPTAHFSGRYFRCDSYYAILPRFLPFHMVSVGTPSYLLTMTCARAKTPGEVWDFKKIAYAI